MSIRKRHYKKEYALAEKRAGKSGQSGNAKQPINDFVWEYDFSYENERYRQTGFLTKRDAEAAEAEKKQEVRQGVRPVKKSGSPTLGEVMAEFLDYRRTTNAVATVENEKRKTKQIFERLKPDKRVRSMTVREIQKFQTGRIKDGKNPHTVNLELTLLRKMFDYACDNGYVSHNPARRVKNLQEIPSEEVIIPSQEEFTSLATVIERKLAEAEARKSTVAENLFESACIELITRQQVYAWLWLDASSGMRPSEIFHLEWSDIDFSGEKIIVRPKIYPERGVNHRLKNRASRRVIDMNPEMTPILLKWKASWGEIFGDNPPHQWVFFNPRQKKNRLKSVRKLLVEAGKEAGLQWEVNHKVFRHYFISRAVMSGVDLLTITKWVGHTSTKMIERVYAHIAPDHKKEQMAKVRIAC